MNSTNVCIAGSYVMRVFIKKKSRKTKRTIELQVSCQIRKNRNNILLFFVSPENQLRKVSLLNPLRYLKNFTGVL
jgi:hypothetical protein